MECINFVYLKKYFYVPEKKENDFSKNVCVTYFKGIK